MHTLLKQGMQILSDFLGHPILNQASPWTLMEDTAQVTSEAMTFQALIEIRVMAT